MGNICAVCSHPDRLDIDRKLVRGVGIPTIADEFDLGVNSLYRHKVNHLSRQLKKAFELKQEQGGLDLVTEMEEAFNVVKRVRDEAISKNQNSLTLEASDRIFNALDKINRWHEFAIKHGGGLKQEPETIDIPHTEIRVKSPRTIWLALDAANKITTKLTPTERYVFMHLVLKMEGDYDGPVSYIDYRADEVKAEEGDILKEYRDGLFHKELALYEFMKQVLNEPADNKVTEKPQKPPGKAVASPTEISEGGTEDDMPVPRLTPQQEEVQKRRRIRRTLGMAE